MLALARVARRSSHGHMQDRIVLSASLRMKYEQDAMWKVRTLNGSQCCSFAGLPPPNTHTHLTHPLRGPWRQIACGGQSWNHLKCCIPNESTVPQDNWAEAHAAPSFVFGNRNLNADSQRPGHRCWARKKGFETNDWIMVASGGQCKALFSPRLRGNWLN